MKKIGWVEFRWKPPHSAVQGRPLPEDFRVVVARKGPQGTEYELMSATDATDRWMKEPDIYLAWTPIYDYDNPGVN